MPSINDWAAKAARRVLGEFADRRKPTAERLAAVLVVHLEPLVRLLEESRRAHLHCDDDSWYCCGKCAHPDHGCSYEEDDEHGEDCWPTSHRGRTAGVCDCGAEAWNARVDAVLAGVKEAKP